MNKLREICLRKLAHVSNKQAEISFQEIKEKAMLAPPTFGFFDALRTRADTAIIAEVKKASPSKGVIRVDFDAVEIAKTYEKHGAACISVLTDEPFFMGKDEFLIKIREAVNLPLLRKDFMISPYQIYESRTLGADCVLLIMAAVDDDMAQELFEIATNLTMDVLVEVHDAHELERALRLKPDMIGVNNRSLKTLQVDIQTSHHLAPGIPDTMLKIAESGIDSPETIRALRTSGYKAFLIGESLVKEPNIGKALETLLQK